MTRRMTRLTVVAATTGVAIAVGVPFTLAQTAPKSDPAPPAASSHGYEAGSNMMYGQAQVPSQGQAQGSTQGAAQAGYGPGMMYGQGQSGYGPGMMGGYGGAGWMGGYGGLLVPILLVLAVVGLVAWVVKQKSK